MRTVVGPWLPFEVTRFQEGHLWTWRVGGVPATAHRVESLGARRSRVGIDVPLMATPYVLLCGVALQRIDAMARAKAGARR